MDAGGNIILKRSPTGLAAPAEALRIALVTSTAGKIVEICVTFDCPAAFPVNYGGARLVGAQPQCRVRGA